MSTLRTQYENYLFVNQDSKLTFEEWEQRVFTPTIQNGIKQITERYTSWDNPQLSDGDIPIRMKNALKNTFPDMDLEVQKEMTPQTQLEELNDYLIMLAKMDTIGVRRKLVLMEGYINKVRNQLKDSDV